MTTVRLSASLPPKGRHAHISTKVLSGQRSPTAHGRVTNLGDQRHRAGKFFLSVPAHTCAVGLYCKATRAHLRLARAALATAPQCRPKGSLSLTQKGQAYARPNSHKRYLLAISMIYCIMEQIATHPASATICIRAIVNQSIPHFQI